MKSLANAFWEVNIYRYANYKQYYWCAETYCNVGAVSSENGEECPQLLICQKGYSTNYNTSLEDWHNFAEINKIKHSVVIGEIE